MKIVNVKTSARLAMCLIDMNGERGRVDGCVGFSIKDPSIELSAYFTDDNLIKIEVNNIEATEKQNLIKLIEKIRKKHDIKEGINIKIKSFYDQHKGLGSGTQLKLSIAAAINTLFNNAFTNIDLAREVERGGTSGIGVWTFDRGGFIVDGGHSFGEGMEKQSFLPSSKSSCDPPPLVFHHPFPEDWGILCIDPITSQKLYGVDEYNLFKNNCPIDREEVNKLSWTILMRMLPAVVNRNLQQFNAALEEMQSLAFKKVVWKYQPETVLISKKIILAEGIRGVGLSSLGNTLFVVVHKNQISELQRQLESIFQKKSILCKMWSTSGNNEGAKIEISK